MTISSPQVTHGRRSRALKAWEEAGEVIKTRVEQQTIASQNLRLKAAITAAVVSKELREGDQLPPEPAIAELTGISLGTVRRALAKLAADGIVERIHGRGTFVSNYSRYFGERWHFRFLDPATGEPAPVEMRLLERKLIFEDGPWTSVLGIRDGYVRFRRLAVLAGSHFILNEFVAPGDRLRDLMRVPLSELEEGGGLRRLIADRFQYPVISSRRTARLAVATREMAELMNITEGEKVMKATIIGLSFDDEPVFYQNIWVPDIDYELDLTPPNQGTVLGSVPV